MQLKGLITAALITATSYANDDFADAEPVEYVGDLISRSGNTTLASVEPGEPNPLDAEDVTASYWYALTVDTAQRLEIYAVTSNVDAIISVYTGTALDDLNVVSRYSTMDVPAVSRRGRQSSGESYRPGEPLSLYARLTLDAVPGTTYYVSIAGEGNIRGAYTLNFAPSRNNLVPTFELLPARSEWTSLIHRDEFGVPIAPDTDDEDFYTTWQTPGGYDGPDFSAPQSAPIGYGTVNALQLPLADGLWLPDSTDAPPSGSRNTSYHRTTFTPGANVSTIGLEGLLDDGAIFYINGTEVGRLNMAEDAASDDWTQVSLNQAIPDVGTTEDDIQYLVIDGLNLTAGQPVEFAMSLHNQGSSSSDMGFDLRIFAVGAVPPPQSQPIALSISEGEGPGRFLLNWTGIAGSAYNIEENVALAETGWTTVNPSPIEPATTGPVSEPVVSGAATKYYRVVPIAPAP